MPRDDDYDDYGDRPARAPFPGGVKAAGIIWIAFGILGLLGQITSFIVNTANQAAQAGPGPPGGNVCSVGCGVLFAMAFLVIGIQTVKGTAKGMLGNGIGSLVFGLIYVAIAIFAVVMAASGRLPGVANTMMFVLGGLMALLALALLTAGILAIAGRERTPSGGRPRASTGPCGRGPRRSGTTTTTGAGGPRGGTWTTRTTAPGGRGATSMRTTTTGPGAGRGTRTELDSQRRTALRERAEGPSAVRRRHHVPEA